MAYEDCPSICYAPNADPVNGCPDCEYQNAVRVFKKEYEGELRRFYERRIRQSVTGDTLPRPEAITNRVEDELARPPSFLEIQGDYNALCEQEEAVGIELERQEGGFNPLWSIRTAEGVRIIREERRRLRREQNREANRELDTRLRQLGLMQ